MWGMTSVFRRALTCAAAAALLLAGCDGGTGEGDPLGSPSTSSEEGGRDAGGAGGTRPTELPTDLRECPPPDKDADATATRVPGSVAEASYDVPAGFSADGVGGLGQIEAAEGDDYEDTYYLLDVAVGVETLALVHYRTLVGGPVVTECDRLDLDEVLARLADHNARSGSEVTSAPVLVEIAGAPAVLEERSYPDVGITVLHYWIYGRADMLNIQCQWTSHEAEVRAGCDALLASMSLG